MSSNANAVSSPCHSSSNVESWEGWLEKKKSSKAHSVANNYGVNNSNVANNSEILLVNCLWHHSHETKDWNSMHIYKMLSSRRIPQLRMELMQGSIYRIIQLWCMQTKKYKVASQSILLYETVVYITPCSPPFYVGFWTLVIVVSSLSGRRWADREWGTSRVKWDIPILPVIAVSND